MAIWCLKGSWTPARLQWPLLHPALVRHLPSAPTCQMGWDSFLHLQMAICPSVHPFGPHPSVHPTTSLLGYWPPPETPALLALSLPKLFSFQGGGSLKEHPPRWAISPLTAGCVLFTRPAPQAHRKRLEDSRVRERWPHCSVTGGLVGPMHTTPAMSQRQHILETEASPGSTPGGSEAQDKSRGRGQVACQRQRPGPNTDPLDTHVHDQRSVPLKHNNQVTSGTAMTTLPPRHLS